MKKLSVEEKAKRYDGNYKAYIELINRLEDVKEAIKKQNYGIAMNVLCKPYPQFQVITHSALKESGDERVLKIIKETLKSYNGGIVFGSLSARDYADCLAWLEKQFNLMKALQISNAKIGELIEKNYYLKEQLEKQGKNNMGISEATKQELDDNLNKALEKETPESCNEFLEKQGSKKENIKERNICDTCEDSNGCLIPCCAKLLEKQGEQKTKTPEESLGIDSDIYNKIVDECVYGEQKPAWSEEDEKILNLIIARLHSHPNVEAEEYGKDYHWFKSLKERYVWKPSDGQMECLGYAIEKAEKDWSPLTNNRIYLTLKALKEQLFELRGSKV